jgi:type IV fimbrial biogenesis protein FimT
MNYVRQYGFVALEHCVVIVLGASLALLLVPNLDPLLRSDKLSGPRAEFTDTLAFARSESIKRGLPVRISASAPAFGNEYGGGWKACVDQNGNGTCDLGELIDIHGALPNTATLRSAGNKASIAFDAHGNLFPASAVQFSLCAINARTTSYLITIKPDGLFEVSNNALCP